MARGGGAARLCLGIMVACLSWPANAAEVRVAVAANFLMPLRALAPDFSRASGHELVISAGSTGKLYAQIIHGAPFDVFLAADAAAPQRLEAAGLTAGGSRITYARGRLVLWSADPERIPPDAGALLQGGDLGRVAIANPRIAPYGAAAMAVLEGLGIARRLHGRLVRAESVGQAFQFTATGNADVGFVAYSQVLAHGGRGSLWRVPLDRYPPIRQEAVVLQRASQPAAARAFLAWLTSPAVQQRLVAEFGYGPTGGAAAP